MTSKNALFPAGFTERDIFFECPSCGKSLGIDQGGAGLVVTCSDCGTRMKVPVPDFSVRDKTPGVMSTVDYTEAVELTGDLTASRSVVDRLKVEMEDLGTRKEHLEHLRSDHLNRFEKISEEIAVIQTAIDRVVDLLQDVLPELRDD